MTDDLSKPFALYSEAEVTAARIDAYAKGAADFDPEGSGERLRQIVYDTLMGFRVPRDGESDESYVGEATDEIMAALAGE